MTVEGYPSSFQLIEKGICSGITNCVSACNGKGACCQSYSPRFSLLELGLLAAYDISLAKEIIQKGTPLEVYGFDPEKEDSWKFAFRLGQRNDPCPFLTMEGCALPYEVRTLPCRTYLCLRGQFYLLLHTSHYKKYKKLVKHVEKYDQWFYHHFFEMLESYSVLQNKPLEFTSDPWLDQFLPILMKEGQRYDKIFHDFLASHWDPAYRPELHYHYFIDDFWRDMESSITADAHS